MNEQKRLHMHSYFDRQIAAYKAEAETLTRDHRQDEAVFAKVRLNIYDVFRTVFTAAEQCEADTADFFLAKLRQIPQNWRASLELALQHGDTEKAHLEQIKLDTAAQIQSAFTSIWEGEK